MPLVSIIMAAKNEASHIGEAIEGVLQQTYDHWELIVIDDHSSDRTAEIVRSFHHPRILLYSERTSEPGGLAFSRNLGAHLARGTLIAYQDADDYSRPLRIERQVAEALAGKRLRAVGTWVEQRTAAGSRVCQFPVCHEEIVAGFLRGYDRVTMVGGTTLLPRSVAQAVPLRLRFKYLQDWDQLCRIHESGMVEFRNVPEVLYIYNISPKGAKAQKDWTWYNIFERACRARRRSGLPEWRSLEQFREHLARSPRDFLFWQSLRQLLRLKVSLEMRLADLSPGF